MLRATRERRRAIGMEACAEHRNVARWLQQHVRIELADKQRVMLALPAIRIETAVERIAKMDHQLSAPIGQQALRRPKPAVFRQCPKAADKRCEIGCGRILAILHRLHVEERG